MIETKIKWDGDDGTIVGDGTIELAAMQAIEEAKPLADKLLEISQKYGVKVEVVASDWRCVDGDVETYQRVEASHTKSKIQHSITSTSFSGEDYLTTKYVFKRDATWQDYPREAKVIDE